MHRKKFRKAMTALSTAAMLSLSLGSGVFAQSTSNTTVTNPNNTGYSLVQFSDVNSSTPGYQAIIELGALGIVNGFGAASGGAPSTFGPSQTLTRAEFAKMLDLALNQGSAANLMSGTSQFNDVPTGQWYTGYVNAAAARGIVEGYGNGDFGPNDPVTNAQAITMVVRALGYEPAVIGPWPQGYIAEAGQIQNYAGVDALLNGIQGTDPNSPMTRSDAAVLLDNMLYSHLASQQYAATIGSTTETTGSNNSAYGPVLLNADGYTFSAPGQTQFGPATTANEDNNVVLETQANSGLNPNQAAIGTVGNTSPQTVQTESTIGLVGGNNLNDILGQQVSYVLDTQGNLVFVASVTPPQDILTNATLSSAVTPGTMSSSSQVSITPNGASQANTYNATPGGVLILGSSKMAAGDPVNVVLNPQGQVISVFDTKNPPGSQIKNAVLQSVNTSGNPATLSAYVDASSPTTFNVSATVSVTLDGNASTLSALKPNDIVTMQENGQNYITSIQATDTTVSGELTNVAVSGGNTVADIGGTQYTISAEALYVSGSTPPQQATYNVVSGLNNEQVTATIAPNGKVALLTSTTTSSQTGLVIGAGSNFLQVEEANGTITTVADTNTSPSPTSYIGHVVQVTTNSSNGNTSVVDYGGKPYEIMGITGNEIIAQSLSNNVATGTYYDFYAPSGTPVWGPTNGGNTLTFPTTSAATESLSNLSVGDLVYLGTSQTKADKIKGIVIFNSVTTSAENDVDLLATAINMPSLGNGNGTMTGYALGSESQVTINLENQASTNTPTSHPNWGDWSYYIGNLANYGGSGTSAYNAAPLAMGDVVGGLALMPSLGTVPTSSLPVGTGYGSGSANPNTMVAGVWASGATLSGVGQITNLNLGSPTTFTLGNGTTSYTVDNGTVVFNNMTQTTESVTNLQAGDTVQLVSVPMTTSSGTSENVVLYMYVLANPTSGQVVTTSGAPQFVNIATIPGTTAGAVYDFVVNATLENGSGAPIGNATVDLVLTNSNYTNYTGPTIFTGTTDSNGNVSIAVYLGTGETVAGSTATLYYGNTQGSVTVP